MFGKYALVIHDNHLLRMIEYTQIILIAKRLLLQTAKLLIKVNILRVSRDVVVSSNRKLALKPAVAGSIM